MNGPREILDDLLRRAGAEPAGDRVDFIGADPIFNTRYHLGDFGAAAIAAAGLQASRILQQRGGAPQHVTVPVDAAAAGMRNWRYLHEVPPPPPGPPFTVLGFYPTAEGRWIYFQRGMPHHFDRQMKVIGITDDRSEEAISAATRQWRAEDLEIAVFEAGASASMVRTHEEWAQHPQSAAIAALPLFSIEKIGDSAPEPASTGSRPLDGVRVLDVTRVLAGPTAARTLAEQGADVLRISSPVDPEGTLLIRDTGHGKRSTVLDLRTPTDKATLDELVRGADVFSQGYRPGALARLGYSPERLAELRPGIISVSISAFGGVGPWGDYRGFDSVVQAASGVSWDERDERGVPHTVPGNPLDYTSGYLAAFLIELALMRREQEGGSYQISLSLAQTGKYLDDLGAFPVEIARAQPAELSAERLAELMIEGDTGYGRLAYLAPIAQLSGTPGRWDRPSVPVDHDPPRW